MTMSMSDERIRMIGQMALEAGLIEDPQWLERLEEPVPLWVLLDTLLRWIDRMDPQNGPFD
ncbi:hypothetical protein [Cohnella caldifontis]|uniref:hypothetical protein n=1 Tax=Cohnella caldifontis TaxID=3027471 RepID=UPI0023ED2089|nr:hypothetical protein [Cohnella sp. YIM B05605]